MSDTCQVCGRQRPVGVGGLWLRRIGDRVQMLAEVDGKWCLIADEPAEAAFSHIVNPSGIRSAPIDDVTAEGHVFGVKDSAR